ncbi:hypothetical protein FKM82_002943 [Ascaphus truei]
MMFTQIVKGNSHPFGGESCSLSASPFHCPSVLGCAYSADLHFCDIFNASFCIWRSYSPEVTASFGRPQFGQRRLDAGQHRRGIYPSAWGQIQIGSSLSHCYFSL